MSIILSKINAINPLKPHNTVTSESFEAPKKTTGALTMIENHGEAPDRGVSKTTVVVASEMKSKKEKENEGLRVGEGMS
jgi:hypothetical protein